eukprot:TRINITY_DN36484_c0_g1_i2.p1 TRINITY_DN36484_c0_g1~~TRINITY_DN36484_c0_g1_i2.p1  ORF type:complete len:108 (+),score=16.48 TRINITY_DN36484_c0_g1_i2:456-779(+)
MRCSTLHSFMSCLRIRELHERKAPAVAGLTAHGNVHPANVGTTVCSQYSPELSLSFSDFLFSIKVSHPESGVPPRRARTCLLYTSDAADEEDSVDLGGRRIIKKKKE